jgi:hypothetical protein
MKTCSESRGRHIAPAILNLGSRSGLEVLERRKKSLAPTGILKPGVTKLPTAQTLRKVNHSAQTLYSNFRMIFRVSKHYFHKQHKQIRLYNGHSVR